jgi:hypothetical protein
MPLGPTHLGFICPRLWFISKKNGVVVNSAVNTGSELGWGDTEDARVLEFRVQQTMAVVEAWPLVGIVSRPLFAGTLVAEARVRPVSNRHISRATGILARAAGFLFRPCRGLPRCLWNRQIRHRHPPRPLPLPWAHHTIGCIMPAMVCIATMSEARFTCSTATPRRPALAKDGIPVRRPVRRRVATHSLGVSQTGQCSHSENSRSKRYSLFLLTKYLRSTISSAYSR